MHSLRANAGGGPRRRRRGPPGLGAAGKLRGRNGDRVVWEPRGVSQSQPTWRTQPPAPAGAAAQGVHSCVSALAPGRWGSWGAVLLWATVPHIHASLGGGCPLRSAMQYYPRCTAEDADMLEVTHTATQQGTWSPRKERPHPGQLLPTLKACSVLPWQGAAPLGVWPLPL